MIKKRDIKALRGIVGDDIYIATRLIFLAYSYDCYKEPGYGTQI